MTENLMAPQPRIIRTSLAGLFSYLPLVIAIVAICMGAVLAVTFLTHPKYRSEARFLVRNNRGSNVISSSDRSPASPVADVSEEQINSELEILQSEDVLSAVADPSWDTANSSSASSATLKEHEDKLTKLRSHLSISPIRKSNVIEAVYLAPSSQEASATLDRLSAAYLAAHERLARSQGATKFFEAQTDRYQKDWKAAINQLVAFQNGHDVVSVSDTEDKLTQRSNAIQDDIVQNNAHLAELNHELASEKQAVDALSQRNETQVRTLPNQITSQQMRTQLLQLENRKTELLTRYKPTDRLVQEVEHELASTQKALQEADAGTSLEKTTDINPNWQQMQASLIHDQIARDGVLGKNLQLQNQRSQTDSQLKQTEALALEYATLQEAVQQARTNYETFSQKWDQEQIEDAMDGHRLSNVALAEAPTSSFRAFSPRPLMNIALGLVTSVFLVAGLIYVLETFRTTIATPQELDAFSSFPVLATIPMSTHPDALLGGAISHSAESLQSAASTNQELAYAGQMKSTRQATGL